MDILLVPIDFSDYARAALRYAVAVACRLETKVLVYHAFQVQMVAGTNPVAYKAEFEAEQQRAEKRLKAFVADFEEKNYIDSEQKIALEILLTQGDPRIEIPLVAKKRNAALVVMGTQGANGLEETFLGTVTVSVSEDVSCPVLAVPVGVRYQNFDTIVYATDFDEDDAQIIDTLLKLGDYFDALLVCLHIYQQVQDLPRINTQVQFLEEKYEDLPLEVIQFKLTHNKDVLEGLEQYLEHNEVDMLVMLTHKRNFFTKFFKKSITQKIAFQAAGTPLLILTKKK